MERERFYEGCHPPTVSSTSRNARVWADLLLSLARLARCEVRRPVIGRLLEQWPVTNHPPLYLEAIKYAWRFLSLSLSFSPRDTLLRVNLIRAAWDMTFRNREREGGEVRTANWNLSSPSKIHSSSLSLNKWNFFNLFRIFVYVSTRYLLF